jgi:hypothetical protein
MADTDLTCAVLLFPKGTQGLPKMSACAKSNQASVAGRGLPKATSEF